MPTYNISYAVSGVAPVECTNRLLNFWRIRWDFEPVVDEEHHNVELTSFKEYQLDHKPTIEEVKQVILDWYNSKIDEEIVSGFSYNGMPVWLSSENQFNYKAAYDLAIQTNGATLPVTFKFGTNYDPVYKTFTTKEELMDFYISALSYVTEVLNRGWIEKDSFDWSPYEEALSKL